MTGVLTPSRRRSFLEDGDSTSNESVGDHWSINVLASPPQAYKYENNRRYHAYREGSYWGPNDELDALHQKVTHHLLALLLQDRLHLAPIPRPRHVLDIGTGIGLWASDMADAHSTAQVLGTDLSPAWHNTVAPNLSFEVDDCCSQWTYLDEGRDPFDLIHIRCLYGSVKDWKKLYQQAFDHLEPGIGYIEQAELSLIPHFCYTSGFDGPTYHYCQEHCHDQDSGSSSNSIFLAWYEFWQECSVKTGKTWLVADEMSNLIYETGFENVREVRYMLPLFECADDINHEELVGGYSDYPVSRLGEIRKWFQEFWETGMEGWVLAISTRYMGWTVDKAKEFVAKTKEILAEQGHQGNKVYYELVVVYGQRPGER